MVCRWVESESEVGEEMGCVSGVQLEDKTYIPEGEPGLGERNCKDTVPQVKVNRRNRGAENEGMRLSVGAAPGMWTLV